MADKMKIIYNRIYEKEQWEPLVLRPDAFSPTRYDETARMLRNERDDGKVLEIGCGAGQFIMAFSNHFQYGVGVDISTNRIMMAHKILQERYPELMRKLEFREVDVEQSLPFEDESFDIVILCAVAEHTVDLFGLMDETARVCKKGGCVVMTVPNICYLKHVKELVLGQVPITTSVETATIAGWRHCGWDGGHLHYFSKKMLSNLLRDVGFEPEEWGGSGRWAKLRRWYINFVGDLIVRARRK